MEDAISGNEIVLCLPALAATHLPLCLWWGDGPICRQLALLWYSFNPLFCEQAWQCLGLELFMGKLSLSLFIFLSLAIPQFVLLCHVPSDCPQGIQAWLLP